MIKLVMLAALVVVLLSLGSALYQMIRHQGGGEKMVRALTVRIGVSVALILFVIVAAALGWITPHGLMPVPAGG